MHFRHMRLPLLSFIAGLILGGCGVGGESASDQGGGNGVDRAFVKAMVRHHRSTVDMARVARNRGRSQFVKRLADEIIRTQKAEIQTMQREDEGLDIAGVKRGTLALPEHQKETKRDLARLRGARPFDRAFIDMMIPHEQGAIRLARVEASKGADPELKSVAGEVITAQVRDIESMNTHRRRAFGRPSPVGTLP